MLLHFNCRLAVIFPLLFCTAALSAIPVASAIINPPIILCENENINIRVHPSVFTDSLTVNWGDGTMATYTVNPLQVSHSYSGAGIYFFTLIAYDPGVTDTFQTSITVVEIPIASFTHSFSDTICAGNSIQFTDQSVFTAPVNYLWTFGDGGMSNIANPVKQYSVPGTYIIKLVIWNTKCSDEHLDTITITADTLLADDFTAVAGCPCNKITFNAGGTASTWKWFLGNGDSASGQNIIYDYPKPGKYIITLKGTDNTGYCSWSIKKRLTVCDADIIDTSRSNANWYIGGGPVFPGPPASPAGIHFGNGAVSASATGSLIANEGVATMSDSKSGALLFYTEGVNIYDRTHAIMPNGNNLEGHWSSIQSSFIVPYPGNRDRYYVFTVDGYTSFSVPPMKGYYYSVVDMSLNGGLGQVIQKNIPLYTKDSASCMSPQGGLGIPFESITGIEKVRPTCKQNGEYWVIIPTCNNEFRSYLITDQGIQNPIISSSPYSISWGGAAAISPDGTKYVITNPATQPAPAPPMLNYPSFLMMDFDINTGALTNQTGDGTNMGHGVCFSSDNSKLYIGRFDTLVQFDLLAADFWKSEKVIASSPFTPNPYVSMYMGINDTLYVSRRDASYIGMITAPDNPGASCNYVNIAVNLPGGAKAKDGLQNIITLPPIDSAVSYFTHTIPACGTFTVAFTNLSDSILPPIPPPCSFPRADDTIAYYWNYGDGNPLENYYITDNGPFNLYHPVHTYSPGTYTVSLIVESNFQCAPDTFFSIITIDSVPVALITGDTTVCSGITVSLTASGGSSYSWNTGTTNSTINISPVVPTTYTVVVSNGTCSDTADFFVNVFTSPVVSISGISSVCNGDSIMLTASGTGNYSWSTGSTAVFITQYPTGNTSYTLTGTDTNGCSDTATISILVNTVPVAVVSEDDTICAGQNVLLTAAGGNSYSWNNGPALSSFNVSPLINSVYSVSVSNGNCFDTASVRVVVNQPPLVWAGNDTTIFSGSIVALTSGGGPDCIWSPPSGLSCTNCCNPNASPSSTTTYYITVIDANGCTNLDSITIFIEEPLSNCINIKIPNAFSPNGDGQNDMLQIYGSASVKNILFTIYNRWGEKVFETNDANKVWDGAYKNYTTNSAVFTYIFQGTCISDGSDIYMKGNISMIR